MASLVVEAAAASLSSPAEGEPLSLVLSWREELRFKTHPDALRRAQKGVDKFSTMAEKGGEASPRTTFKPCLPACLSLAAAAVGRQWQKQFVRPLFFRRSVRPLAPLAVRAAPFRTASRVDS